MSIVRFNLGKNNFFGFYLSFSPNRIAFRIRTSPIGICLYAKTIQNIVGGSNIAIFHIRNQQRGGVTGIFNTSFQMLGHDALCYMMEYNTAHTTTRCRQT